MSFVTGTNVETLYASTAVGASLNTFTTEALLNTTATMGAQYHLQPDFWLPNPKSAGQGIAIVAFGTLASTGSPTYTLSVRGGAAGNVSAATTVWAGTSAMTTIAGATTAVWKLEAYCILKTLGAAGTGTSTLFSTGYVDSDGLLGTGDHRVAGGLTTAGTLVAPGTVATLDTSITNYINLTVACSASSASNIFALTSLQIFGLN